MRGLVLFVAGVFCGLAVQTTMAQNDTTGGNSASAADSSAGVRAVKRTAAGGS